MGMVGLITKEEFLLKTEPNKGNEYEDIYEAIAGALPETLSEDAFDRAFDEKLGQIIESKIASFEGAYIVNPANYKRFIKVFHYYKALAAETDGVITHFCNQPERIHAGFSVVVPYLDLVKQAVKEYAQILSYVDVLGVEATGDNRIKIDVSVNYVWSAHAKDGE